MVRGITELESNKKENLILINSVKNNDEKAFLILKQKYEKTLKHHSRLYRQNFEKLGYDVADVYQLLCLKLWNAAMVYDPSKNDSFQAFLSFMLKRQIKEKTKYFYSEEYCRGKILNNTHCFTSLMSKKEYSNGNILPCKIQTLSLSVIDNYSNLFLREEVKNLKNISMSMLERMVLVLRMKNIKYSQIADICSKKIGKEITLKMVDNALLRVKKKIKKKKEDSNAHV